MASRSCWRLVLVIVGLLVGPLIWVEARQAGGRVPLDADDIGGVVTGATGPEAGVWVIAETKSLPTPFARIVVTDDQGRYVVPDLPRGNYDVFVRGYGLVDSPRQPARLGQQLNLKPIAAPTRSAAAEIYPPAYWLAMMKKPVGQCALACHQVGNKATRQIPPSIAAAASSSLDAWDRRVASGVEGPGMFGAFKRLGADREAFAEWTDRVAKGELPREAPSRPAGLERNLVVTVWDWGTKLDGRTDAVASDLRNGLINPNGDVYMVARSTDVLAVLDPLEHRSRVIKVPSKAPETYTNTPPSVYWGKDPVWKRNAEPRSLAMDARGRLWMTAIVREKGAGQPAFCTSQANKFARHFPIAREGGRQVTLYDPATARFTPIAETCFTADHNNLGSDDFLYFGATDVVAWIDTAAFDKTKDVEASQGWCPAVVDTNGDGKITEWTEPTAPIDATKDHRVSIGCYQVAVDPTNKNGVAWCGDNRRLTRIERGPSPPESCRAEVYQPPTGTTVPEVSGAGEATVDGNGVVWVNWRGSQHFTSFDRRKCGSARGPALASGESCPEGWSVYRKGGPTYEGTDVEADLTYLPQVDRHNALGLGKDVPIYGTVNTDMLVAFLPQSKQFLSLRVPYPMGFFSRSSNGRIDDPRGGWKGKGVWSSFSTYAAWHVEGGYLEGGMKGNGSKAVKFQMRPDPLAK